ncbi:M28 family peptidase [Williamwhitmania taraxaci]|uniref:Zn-dependent amino-or carboxypeptidase, M28 family n=1 Tax=Williamwhitmania taraxaci TaxID=1640674 RepID=A0A1G6RA65_9BACT|nr:M28 family peptidase [Williamwhitmania taraxaci]SDD00937.1 Zn-dependent amino-or carboxypeptidase, M28 family [Williamwhitmania taraxaci]
MKRLLYLILSFTIACSGPSAETASKVITSEGIAADITILAADSLQGRGPCTIGEVRTLSYLQSRMKELGLEPAFNGSYLQQVPLVNIFTRLVGNVEIGSPNGDIPLINAEEITVWSPVLEKEIVLSNVPMVFVGFGIRAPEYGWDDYKGMDVRGKVVIVLVNDTGFYTKDTTLFKGNQMTYYGRWRYKFEEAERQGASACIIVHEEAAAGYPWGVVQRRSNGSDYYVDEPIENKMNCKVQGWITSDIARKLFTVSGLSYDELKAASCNKGFSALPLLTTLSQRLENRWNKCVSYNVAGIIRGSEKPNEALVYAAHWDHLGIGTVVDGDSIYNGASDNAAAIAGMFAVAKAFKEMKQAPKRSVLFFVPTCEESGMLGSTYYVNHPAIPMDSTIACLNSDVILFLGKFKDVTVTGLGHSQLDDFLREEAEKQGRYICNDPNPENGMFYRSDQLPFLLAGVPSLFAKGYTHQTELGKEKTLAKIAEYWKTIYHKPSDQYDPIRDNLEGLVEDSKLFFLLGNRLTNDRMVPTWNEKSEFFKDRCIKP